MKITTHLRSCPITREARLEALDIRDNLIERINSFPPLDNKRYRRCKRYLITIDRNLYGGNGGLIEL